MSHSTVRRLAVALGVTACLFSFPLNERTRAQGGGISPQAMAQIQALLAEKASRTATQQKVDSQLLYARRIARRQQVAQGVATLSVDVPTAVDGRVVVDVRASVTPALMQRLQSAGVTVLSAAPGMKAMRLPAPPDRIQHLPAYSGGGFISPIPPPSLIYILRSRPSIS